MNLFLCDGNCSACDLLDNENFGMVLRILSEVDQDDLPIIERFCPPILKKFQDYWVNTAFPKGILFERNARPCEGSCGNCALVFSKNSKVLSAILNALRETADEVPALVNGHCPNLTVCPECRIDDFCHIDDCSICAAVDEAIGQED